MAGLVSTESIANSSGDLRQALTSQFERAGATVLNGSLSAMLPTDILTVALDPSAGQLDFAHADALLNHSLIILTDVQRLQSSSARLKGVQSFVAQSDEYA